MSLFVQLIGWFGTFLVILAYILVSNKKVTGDNVSYQMMNLIGSICVGINVYYAHAWPSFALQIIWGFISVSILVKKFV